VGTYKQLKTKNVVEKEGGIAGLGSSEKLKSDFNQEYFTKVDITKVQNIPLHTKKAELITAHPIGSYEFEKNDKKVITNLIITDPEKFWEASKYLIVMTD
jgi:galactitol-specific phosphotransferase system IIB component